MVSWGAAFFPASAVLGISRGTLASPAHCLLVSQVQLEAVNPFFSCLQLSLEKQVWAGGVTKWVPELAVQTWSPEFTCAWNSSISGDNKWMYHWGLLDS